MSKMTFSSEQQAAIYASGCNYLISAGAGSGKTAVLTERIYQLAKKANSLDKFLVVTFTNLAAEEMKHRVRTKLVDDPETIHLASEVDNAHIETFDSFCLYLTKKYFYHLNISKDITVVDTSILSIKRGEYLDEILEERYKNPTPVFAKTILDYCAKNDTVLRDYIIRLLMKSDSKGDKYGYLNELKENYFNDSIVEEAISDLYHELINKINYIRTKAESLECVEDATKIIEFCDGLLDSSSYDELYEKIQKPFPTKVKGDYGDKEYRDSISKFYKDKIKVNPTGLDNNYGDSKKIKEKYLSTKDAMLLAIEIAIEVEEKLDAFKKEKNAYSFGDISRFVLALLKDEEIRKEISDSFDYLMIDEYQDTNDIQDLVISSIAKDNIYMVGDVKQSIYRFRGADSHIFQEKYENYKKNIGGKEIDLNNSYRSRKQVVDFINELFEQIMIPEINAIDYSKGHRFGYGNTSYTNQGAEYLYKPEAYLYSLEDGVDKAEYEARLIANDILRRKKAKFPVYDKTLRECKYSDFAIIMDRYRYFDTFKKVFNEMNIPLKIFGKEPLFASDISMVVKSLIKMFVLSLDSNYGSEYHHAYFSVARSFLCGYKDDKLYEIHQSGKYLLEPFAQKMELIKESLRFASIKDIVITLFEQYEIYQKVITIGDYYMNVHKLETIISFAQSLDALGYTIVDFINYVDSLSEHDEDIDFKDNDNQDDSVTLINIFGSKGLEYRIIYFPGLDLAFNRKDINSSYLISDKYGLVCADTSDNQKSSAFVHLVKEEGTKADFEEKIRLLYVALTRAKEKIIFVSNRDKIKAFKYPLSSNCMNDLLAMSNVLDKYAVNFSSEDVELPKVEAKKESTKVNLKKIKVDAKLIKKQRASKNVDDASRVVLDFGSEVHAYLENIDLDNDDLSYIKNWRMRRIVENVKNSSLFEGVTNDMVRHEYPFFDEENNLSGVIDALIIKDDEIDIIDFKLKNIDEEEYDRQLRLYRDYIYKITDKKIRLFLLAALTGEIREVI